MTVRTEIKHLAKAAGTQLRVTGALVLREMRVRFGRSQLGYLWAIAEPLAYILVFSALFTFIGRHPPVGTNMALFFATGILPFTLFRNVGNQLAAAFSANKALLNYPIVQPIDTIYARALLEVATAVFIMLVVFATIVLAMDAPFPHDILRMTEALLLLSLLGFGVGLFNAVVIEHIPSWQNTFRILMMPMLFISGVFFSLESMPPDVRAIVAWNPVLHGVEMFRDGYYSSFRATGLDPVFLLECGLFSTLVSLAAERFLRGRTPA